MNDQVRVEMSAGVQTLRFDRGENDNALTEHMFEAAADAISLGEGNSRVRALLIAGMPGVFTTGHDVAELHAFVRDQTFGGSAIRFLKTLTTVEKPLIAAIDGLAVGIGTSIVLHCDFVVASEWSVFSAPCTDLGLAPEGGASLIAPRLMGSHRAFELLVMGEPFDAHRAQAAGIVNRVVPAGEVEDAAFAAAQAIAAKPPEAVRLARRLIRGDRREVLTRIDVEANGFTDLLQSPSARDAFYAFLDRGR